MRRTTTLATVLTGTALLGATLLSVPHAVAAGETCRGEAATIVGTTPTLTGTDGRDVIVTGSSTDVFAGAGDDVVCVTGKGVSSNVLDVDAGPGNDVVDSTAMRDNVYLTAILGDGSDTFAGGAGADTVVAGGAAGPHGEAFPEAERDVIDTGSGSDQVRSGGAGLTNGDEIRTGDDGDSVTWSGTMGPAGTLDLGTGHDGLMVRASGQRFAVDLAAQTMTRDGVREASFASVEHLSVTADLGLGTLEVTGSDGDDSVAVVGPAILRVALGAGDDRLYLEASPGDDRIDLGSGRDRLSVASRDGSVDLDLQHGTLAVDGAGPGQVAGVEDAWVSSPDLRLVGDAAVNDLTGTGCRVVVDGRGGKDEVAHANFDADVEEGYDCDTTRVVLRGGSGGDTIDGSVRADRIYGGRGNDRIDTASARSGTNKAWGGPGNDRMVGGGDRDVLVGGPGRDKAVGGPGRDRCRAEVARSCER
jgi:Ca2+-binding RTX toxin-like protein